MFHLFAAFAKFERNLILARARGRLGGRPEKFTEKDIELLKTLVDNGTPIKRLRNHGEFLEQQSIDI